MPYDIHEHRHRFAAWTAGRAASVKGNRFSVAAGRSFLERAGITSDFCDPNLLPDPQSVDEWHRAKRIAVIEAAKTHRMAFTHGVAAKLINVYFKARFVCPHNAEHPRVMALHPPIDAIVLAALRDDNIGGLQATTWRRACKVRWSNLDLELYEEVVRAIRDSLNGKPMWMIEEFWTGHQ